MSGERACVVKLAPIVPLPVRVTAVKKIKNWERVFSLREEILSCDEFHLLSSHGLSGVSFRLMISLLLVYTTNPIETAIERFLLTKLLIRSTCSTPSTHAGKPRGRAKRQYCCTRSWLSISLKFCSTSDS